MLERMFSPRSIAVVGASRDPEKVGSMLLRNILDSGYEGKVTVINPKASEIRGLTSLPSLLDVDGDLDLVIVAVPATFVKKVLLDGVQRGALGRGDKCRFPGGGN